MSVKFTSTEIESKNGKLELLFEFLDRELPEEFSIDYMYSLAKSKYIGSLQSAQIMGAYLEPMVLTGKFIGDYVTPDGEIINAKERSDQLGRLALRPIKFFFENFKQIVIFEQYKRKIKNLEHVEFELVMFPHDIQNPVKPTLVTQFKEMSMSLEATPLEDESNIDKQFAKDIQKKFKELEKKQANPEDIKRVQLSKFKSEEIIAKNIALEDQAKQTDLVEILTPNADNTISYYSNLAENIKDKFYSKGFSTIDQYSTGLAF